jgi:hypothetical protein
MLEQFKEQIERIDNWIMATRNNRVELHSQSSQNEGKLRWGLWLVSVAIILATAIFIATLK